MVVGGSTVYRTKRFVEIGLEAALSGLIRRQPGLARNIELLVEPESLPRLQLS
ncbi:hypothetical protein NKH33_16115 [Mesorhizobium sp. M1182]|uniref:hypothetical protein n=1 Tax=Mesorhizobium sp. M1182 TaxID=2957067 RepID=UPI00333D7F86